METFIFRPKGVCPYEMKISHENGIVVNLEVSGGCSGNLKAMGELIKGMKAEDIIKKLRGLTCGGKQTSCADQIAQALEKNLQK